jgi:hypothetical protein
LLVLVGLLIAGALAVSAQDEEAPIVAGPKDVPGADIIWKEGAQYVFNATGSTDDTGIVLYTWQIGNPDGTETFLNSTTPLYAWTPPSYGIYKVYSWAIDAAGNKGFKVFTMDVVEVISAQTIAQTTVSYNHSVAVTSGALRYSNANIDITGGLKRDAAGAAKGEQISEKLENKGPFAGKWDNYYPEYSRPGYYGYAYEDTDVKLVGKASIRNSGGNYHYGLTYTFENSMDLTDYTEFTFWVHSGYYTPYMYYLYFYDTQAHENNYQYPAPYIMYYVYSGGNANNRGWRSISIDLDLENVGRWYAYYGMTDFSDVKRIRIYAYNRQNNFWLDGAYFASSEPKDNMTESATPSGEFGGRWSGFSTNSHHYVGSYSVYKYYRSSEYLYYYWNTGVDLTPFNGLKLYTWFTQYYIYVRNVYFYDWNGRYARADTGSSYTFFHYYAAMYQSNWFVANLPMDKACYYDYGIDWTNIRYMRLQTYSYYSGGLYIDGMEFYTALPGAGEQPSNPENIAHGIYALESGTLEMDRVNFDSTSPYGGFVRSHGTMTITSSTFSGLWGTTHPTIMNEGQTYGGIMAYDSPSVTLRDVTITKASSSGFYIENSNIIADGLDISGTSRDYPMSAGMIAAFSGTQIGETDTVRITKSKFHDSELGSGLQVLSHNSRGDATVRLDDVTAGRNGVYGVAMEVSGWSGNITVLVENSEFRLNTASGFAFHAHDSKASPRSEVLFTVQDSDAIENGAYGFLFKVERAILKARGIIKDIETYDNIGNGIGFEIDKMAGELLLFFEGIDAHDNLANGMYIFTSTAGFVDPEGYNAPTEGKLLIDLETCSFSDNEGNGVLEEHTASGAGGKGGIEPRAAASDGPSVILYTVEGKNLTIEKNEGNGYHVSPKGQPQNGAIDSHWNFYNCLFSDNNKDGFYIYDYYYTYGNPKAGYTKEYYYFYNCTFTYNDYGLHQYWGQAGYGMTSWVKIRECTFQDNDHETIYAHGYWYPYYDCGYSFLEGAEYDIQNTLLDGDVTLDISGAMDMNGAVDPWIYVILINNTYTSDQPMYIRLGSYAYTYNNFLDARVIYKNNKHTSPSTGDGIHIEMYGGTKLKGLVDISDQSFNQPLGNGIFVRFGTLYPSYSYRKTITGHISITDVTINEPFEDGVVVETTHRDMTNTMSTGYYTLLRTNVNGAGTGIRTSNMDGEIRQCSFTNIKGRTLYTYFGVIDVYESDIGDISEANLVVDEKGAIRLWFQMRVRVLWKGTEEPVFDANVEIKDNSWTIIGVNTIRRDEDGVLFTNLNSYSVLPEGIFTKNPYIVTVDYLGIIEETNFKIDRNLDVTIFLQDDIQPRLTIETPKDGLEQREPDIMVKGTAYDKHTGLDHVDTSIDGETWWMAEMGPDGFTYTYTINDVPEGLVIVRVRAMDIAGNYKHGAVTVFVDNTPPSLTVITPTDGMRTNKRFLEIVGTTDVGANVYVNDQPIDIQYTLISHLVTLAEGPNAIKVSALDYLGNVNEIVRYVTLDTQAPYIALESPSDGDTVNTPTIRLVGLTETEDITIKVMDQEVMVDPLGHFAIDITLEEGKNDIDIYGRDFVGNERVITVTIILDRSPPWIKLVEPEGDVVTDNDIQVTGYVEEGTRVFVNEREVDVSFGYFTTTISAPDGGFSLDVTALDRAGNEYTIHRALTVDTTSPTMDVTFPSDDHVTSEETLTVTGTIYLEDEVLEEIRDIELFVAGIPTIFNYMTGDFSLDMMLDEGINRIDVRAVDPAGNEFVIKRMVTLDSMVPYLDAYLGNVRTDPNWNEPVSLSDFVYVTGFTEIGVALTINGVSVEVDSKDGYFNYSLELPPPPSGLKISTTIVRVVSTDEAGNTNIQELPVNRLEGVDVKKEEEISSAEWLVLALALVIFGLTFAGVIGYQRIQTQDELIESMEAREAAIVAGPPASKPPARPTRGARARRPSPSPPEEETVEAEELEGDEEEVVIELGEEEVE